MDHAWASRPAVQSMDTFGTEVEHGDNIRGFNRLSAAHMCAEKESFLKMSDRAVSRRGRERQKIETGDNESQG